MSEEEGKSDIDFLFAEYDKIVKESRSAIQIIGLSVSLLSVSKDLKNLNPQQVLLVKASIVLLFFALSCDLASYLLSDFYKPRDARRDLIGSPYREHQNILAERFTELDLQDRFKKANGSLTYLIFLIFCLPLVLHVS